MEKKRSTESDSVKHIDTVGSAAEHGSDGEEGNDEGRADDEDDIVQRIPSHIERQNNLIKYLEKSR